MDDLKEKTADLADHVEDLANTFYKLTVVNVTQKTTNITSAVILAIIYTVLGFLVLVFGGIALSWWLGDLVNSRTGGFLLGSGIFLVVLLILAAMRKKIIYPYIRNTIVRKFYDQ